jgi:hypothetical protein
MDLTTCTIDELIEASIELDDRTAGLFDRLSRITARATGEHGVTVTVNLDGMLTGLELPDRALRQRPEELAAEIYRLTQQASADALEEGFAVLAPVAGAELAAVLNEAMPVAPSGGMPSGPSASCR